MYRNGFSQIYICEKHNIPPSTFNGWIKKYNLYSKKSKFTSNETINRNFDEKLRKNESMLCIVKFLHYSDKYNFFPDIRNI